MSVMNIFKQKENQALDTPKNLPDLAKDMLESGNEAQNILLSDEMKAAHRSEIIVQNPVPEPKPNYQIPADSSSAHIPRLDLNLLRENAKGSNEQSNARLHSRMPETPSYNSHHGKNLDNTNLFLTSSPEHDSTNNRGSPDYTAREYIAANSNYAQINSSKQKSFFGHFESASNNLTPHESHMPDVIGQLYAFHNIVPHKDMVLDELKSLEQAWLVLQKQNNSVQRVLTDIEAQIVSRSADMARKNDGTSIKKVIRHESTPVFIPVVKNLSAAPKNSADITGGSPAGLNDLESEEGKYANESRSQVAYEKRFYFQDGKIASSLQELYDCIIDISHETYYHHVNRMRNDLANWIHDVLQMPQLAQEVRSAKTKNQAIYVLQRAIY